MGRELGALGLTRSLLLAVTLTWLLPHASWTPGAAPSGFAAGARVGRSLLQAQPPGFPGFAALNIITQSTCPPLAKFVDALPKPCVVSATSGKQLYMGAYVIKQKLHRDLPATTLYAYGQSAETATYPGPTIEGRRNTAMNILWDNNINDTMEMLPDDMTIHQAFASLGGIPISPHMHGAEVHSHYDGHPDAWFTAKNETGSAFTTTLFHYPNGQAPSHMWYHDHAIGLTALNVVSGLAGNFFLRDPAGTEKKLINTLPRGKYEMPLLIQDKAFFANGSVKYPAKGPGIAHPVWEPEYFPDTILVNGKVWPYMNVDRAKYRFRLLNAANARFLQLAFVCAAPADYPTFTVPMVGPMQSFQQIGSDGGYLSSPATLSTVLVGPAERLDLVFDFGAVPSGCNDVILTNTATTPFPGGVPPDGNTSLVMKFSVKGPSVHSGSVPNLLAYVPEPPVNQVSAWRYITLDEHRDVNFAPLEDLLGNKHWTDPATETPKPGTTEIWHFVNLTPEMHPIHIHLVSHRVLYRQLFDANGYSAGNCTLKGTPSCYTGPQVVPDANEQGWKDVTKMPPGTVTTILLSFTTQEGNPFAFDPTTGPGYVAHCHILNHEDNDMMRPYKVKN